MQQIPTYIEGQFLVAMPQMGDSRFENTVIFVCAHSEQGAMGFIINRDLKEPSSVEFLKKLGVVNSQEIENIPSEIKNACLQTGGPVEPGRGFVLHSPDFDSKTTLKVTDEISLTATLEILRDLSIGKGPKQYMLTLGYSGWSAGQLEDEIAANGWLVCPPDSEIIFDYPNEDKYQKAMELMGIDPRLISTDTGHA